MRNVIKGIIFDLDGVLTNTSFYHFKAWKQIADELGIYFDIKINERLKGVDRMASLDIILERSDVVCSFEQKQEIAERKNGYYLEFIKTITPKDLSPGVRGLLSQIKATGLKIALGSASKNAFEILSRLEIENYFDSIVDSKLIRRGKPEPEIFVTAALMMGLNCANCAVVEDSLAGILAAKASGMVAVGIGSPELLPDADIYYSETGKINLADIMFRPSCPAVRIMLATCP